jgi:hypothetical protein
VAEIYEPSESQSGWSLMEAVMGRIAIYTAIFGMKDRLKEPDGVIPNADYFCFTDRPGLSKMWRVIPTFRKFINPRLEARMHKLLPHILFPGYESSLWVDGAMRLKKFDPNLLGSGDIVTVAHPQRSCIYDEISVCRQKKFDNQNVLTSQSRRYRAEGFPENVGLSQTGFLFRRHGLIHVRSFCGMWWSEISMGSLRDQCSFEYVSWKMGIPIKRVTISNKDNIFFTIEKHLK